ncbi:anti-CBASS protein Acb1 family protein [Acetobacter persici]|uniref:anti-CBASS protein Acb1 family protein n=1 Tax=Acetobacter persici TaxID=1076596 RepID=UPI00244AC9D1|nr:anti-CBASS Acb1 family protein [Acetobacter persici]
MPRPPFLSRWLPARARSPEHVPSPARSSSGPAASLVFPAPRPSGFSPTPSSVLPHVPSPAPSAARQEPRLSFPLAPPSNPLSPLSASQNAPHGIGPRDMAETLRVQSLPPQADIFRPYQPPRGVRGDGRTHLAMDGTASTNPGLLGWLRQAVAEGVAFPGYPRLAEMSQRAEYRHMVEVIAAEATREWITFRARGTADKKQRLADLEQEFIRLNVRDVLRRMAEYDGYYGMGLLYVDTGQSRTGGGLEAPLLLRPETFRKGSLRALVPIEPVWTTPDQYDTTNPLSAEFYKPSRWWVQGGLLHSTRLLQFISRPVPDLLKPAYNFGGLSLSQMARPAVDNWLRTRQSVSDLLNAFSIVALSTDMSAYAQDPEGLLSRVEAFNRFRSNRGTFVLDKDREKLELLAAPSRGWTACKRRHRSRCARWRRSRWSNSPVSPQRPERLSSRRNPRFL